MRTVFSNRECAHVWASRSQSHGRSGSMFFEDGAIYSYGRHFCIARFVKNERGDVACLVNPDGYSATTSKHQGIVRSAIPSYVQTFAAPKASRDDAAVRSYYADALESALRSASRARRHGEWHIESARGAVRAFNAYAEFFGLADRLELPDNIADALAAAKARAEVEAQRNREVREAREREYAELAAKRAAEDAAKLAAWQRGEDVLAPYTQGPALLRVKAGRIETSKGACVNVLYAPALWSMVQEVRASGEARRCVDTLVGPYELREICANGDVQIGCHFIEYAELARIAELLGLAVPTFA